MSVRTDHHGPVTVVTIDRPERRNAISLATADALVEAFDAFEADEDARVAVITGSGGTFSSGFDLTEVHGADTGYDPDGPPVLGITRSTPSKPVIAAVEGHAVAGGLELALWCDMRVASTTAVFGVFCRRWGVPLIDGGTVRLPRIVGHGRAMDMILTGRPVDAKEALIWGLADRVVAEGTAATEAITLAASIAAFPQVCMRADRASAISQWGRSLDDALLAEAHGGVAPLREEAAAGAARFVAGAGRGGDGV
ncbi:MAG: crotonase/enoyl-CoA hydratase family protein [Acidimicrobiia bacterium]|nr:crotonase/enoyl-CoA hydratase family protein [Acidimicrobiia bacterium]